MAQSAPNVSLPNAAATNGANQHTPRQPKRNQRPRKKDTSSYPLNDGSVSDSVINPLASPRSINPAEQRHHSVAVGAPTPRNPNNPTARTKGSHKQRPASFGGNMLPDTPFKEQAYAGPTFQVSPAPSSLPVPKFFAKSVPNVTAPSALQERMDSESTPEAEQSSPESDPLSPSPSLPNREAQKSPLDLFFKADREERSSRGEKSLSPEAAFRPQPFLSPEAAHRPQPLFRAPARGISDENIFLQDRSGSDRNAESPRTLPPANGHLQSQRPSSSPSINTSAQASDAESDHEAQTKALKALLFSNINGQLTSEPQAQQSYTPPQPQQPRADPSARVSGPSSGTPSPFQRPHSGPSTPSPIDQQQRDDQYHLYYGNQRNLSPLFKAASSRSDTHSSRGPSGLRQQELASEMRSSTISPIAGRYNQAGLPQPPRTIGPNSFRRDYPSQYSNPSNPSQNASMPYASNGVPSPPANGPSITSNGHFQNTTKRGVPAMDYPAPAPQSPSGRPDTGVETGSQDVKGMENDLRRMLNLNVLSN